MRRDSLISRRVLCGLAGLSAALAIPGSALAAPAAPVLLPGPPTSTKVPGAPEARWVQNHRATTVWADAQGATAVAPAPQWSYFRVLGAQVKARIPVYDPRTGAQVWIDVTAVGPSGPPPPASPPAPIPLPGAPAIPTVPLPPGVSAPAPLPSPPPKPGFDSFWIAPFREVPLLLEPRDDAPPTALAPQFAPLRVTAPAKGNYYPVEEPFSKATGWIDAAAIGKIGEPAGAPATRWWGGVVVDQAFARAEPSRSAPVVATYPQGRLLGFANWAEGEEVTWDDPAWGQVADGLYVYGRLTRPIPIEAPPPVRLPSIPSGRWIGINRTVQIVVAYEDDKPQFWARTSTGRPGWETPLGNFQVIRRVAKETMDSATLLGKDAERAKYKIEDVKYTQYFTYDGNAIHENWWKDPDTFGLPSSHGCAGLPPKDAQKFWEFGDTGMPVIVHL